jgi:hypothetical protein
VGAGSSEAEANAAAETHATNQQSRSSFVPELFACPDFYYHLFIPFSLPSTNDCLNYELLLIKLDFFFLLNFSSKCRV